MSNIPEARRILQEAIAGDNSYDSTSMYGAITEALALLDRKKPAFVARGQIKALSDEQKRTAVALRKRGMPLNAIATFLGTNIGRVSEAVNKEAA